MRRPGSRRLIAGGGLLAFGSGLVVWSLLLALLGIGALDFTWFWVKVSSHPELFVLNARAIATSASSIGRVQRSSCPSAPV